MLGLAKHANAAALVILSFQCRVYLHDVDVVEKDIFDADELGALAEEANHKILIQPPRIVIHVEVRSRKWWGDVCKSTLLIAPHRYFSQCSLILCSAFCKQIYSHSLKNKQNGELSGVHLRSVIGAELHCRMAPQQNLDADLLVHVERPWLKPLADVLACVLNDRLHFNQPVYI